MEWHNAGDYWLSTANQGSQRWLDLKQGRPGGSSISSCIGHGYNSPEEQAKILAGITRVEDNELMKHGREQEPIARQFYSEGTGLAVTEVGLAIPKSDCRIAVSVDGLVGEDGMLEIKCPQRMYRGLISSPMQGTLSHHKMSGIEHIRRSHYDQMQMGMAILGRAWCDYLVYCTPEQSYYLERVVRDEKYWQECYCQLDSFIRAVLEPILPSGIPIPVEMPSPTVDAKEAE